MITTDVFKFVTVRPVQTADDFALKNRFLHPFGPSQILDQLQLPGANLSTIAENFMATNDFIRDFNSRGGVLEKLGNLNYAIKHAAPITSDKFVGLVNEIFPSLPAKSTLTNLSKDLWDSLYASVVKIKNFNQDRADIIAALRLIHILSLEGFENLTNQTLRLKLKAKAVIPKALFRGQAQSDNADPGNDNAQNNWHPDREAIDRIRDLKVQIADLDELRGTIELEERRRKKTYKGKVNPIEFPQDNQGDLGGNPAVQLVRYQEVDDGNAIWQLEPEAIDRLGNKNLTLLNNLKVNPQVDDTRFMTARIDETIKYKVDELYQNFGVRSTGVVGTSIAGNGNSKTTQFKIAQPGLEPGLLDPESYWDRFDNLEPVYFDQYNNSISNSLGTVKPLGMGDLLVVKETLLKYDLGEIAHIENVLESEAKERVHRRLERTEETFTTSTESSEETERDLQTTDRYELQRESQKTIESNASFEAGASISAKYGPVQIAADASFSTSSSKSEANTVSSNYAKEIVDKTVSRIKESLKEELVQKTLLEIEETNTHSFDNGHIEGGDPHNIIGLYRFVNKFHLAQVHNYGERLMMEFVIPEPAAMYVHAKLNQNSQSIGLEPPKALEPDFSFQSVKVNNYHTFVRDYNVQGVKPPPPLYTTMALALEQPMAEKPQIVEKAKDADQYFYLLSTKSDNSLGVPEGYVADHAYVYATYTKLSSLDWDMETEDNFASDEDWQFKIIVGKRVFDKREGETYNTMNEEDGTIPIAVKAFNVVAYSFTVEVVCKRTSDKLDEWRIETYDAILDAYNTQKAAYDAAVKAALATATNDFGANPLTKRNIEKEELQRGCITLLTNQHFKDFNALRRDATSEFGYPEINVSDAMNEGDYVKFFNNALDWTNMTYHFYPYFWGNKAYWMDLMNREDIDPDFEAFLRAGYARVVVPVTEGEAWVDVMLYYLETGEIWNGGEAPVIDDPLYLSIIDEIKSADEAGGEAVPIDEEQWEVLLPTSLVMLQEGSELPDYSAELISETENSGGA